MENEWSYSRTSCFVNCKYKFFLQYIVGDENLYPADGNYYAEVGSLVHEILAMIFNGELGVDDALEFYVDNYDSYVFYKVKESIMNKTFELIADYFASLDLSWINDYEVLGVEKEVHCKVGKYNFLGFIDLLLRDKRDGKIVILDHKSSPYPFKKNGEVKKNSDKSFESYKRQMYLYCHAVKKLYGEFPKEIVWNHFKDGGKLAIIPFSAKEYESAIRWYKNTIKKIESEEDFEPTLDFFYCHNLCNFRSSCEYLDAEKESE